MTVTATKTTFARERLTPALIKEIEPLLKAHYDEVCSPQFKDVLKLKPDWNAYLLMQMTDRLKVYVARDEGVAIGYWAFIVGPNPHYMDVTMALGDVLFVHPQYRGIGREFMPWCLEQLKNEGAQFVTCYVKKAHDFSPFLERLGFEQLEMQFIKRLV